MPIRRHPLLPSVAARGVSADEELADRLERSAALLGDLQTSLVPRFYERLFARAPALQRLFPADGRAMEAQRGKLAATLSAVISHLRRPEVLRGPLEELGRRHVGYGAEPEHYPLVVTELVRAMADVVGPAWTQEFSDDWTTALTLVCDVMQGKA